VVICSEGAPRNKNAISFYFVVILISEIIFIVLAMYKTIRRLRYGAAGRLLVALAKDSIKYFIV
jgi:hypothetical protein